MIAIKSPSTKLMDSLFLSGKINQSIDQFCRNLLKPPLPATFAKLGKKAEKSSAWLFGDSLSEFIDVLKTGNKLQLFTER